MRDVYAIVESIRSRQPTRGIDHIPVPTWFFSTHAKGRRRPDLVRSEVDHPHAVRVLQARGDQRSVTGLGVAFNAEKRG
jgi:hypothetical protein